MIECKAPDLSSVAGLHIGCRDLLDAPPFITRGDAFSKSTPDTSSLGRWSI